MYSNHASSALEVPRPSFAMPHKRPLLDIRSLCVEYLTPQGPVRAVDDVSFAIAPGEVFGLAGESGCGKSTVAHAILRILRPPAVITSGQVLFDGDDVLDMTEDELEQFRWQKVALVFQSAMNALNPVMRISDQITDVIHAHCQVSPTTARDRAVELLDLVGIEPRRLDDYPHQLSGGMRQRAVIAIALALNPPLLIMDEPTTALDVVVQKEILQQIDELKTKLGFSILFITHDLSLLVEFSTRIAIMYAGEIVELAPARELFDNPLHPYTHGLMNSFPSISGPKVRLTGISGAPPNLLTPPEGCRFHLRCERAMPQCQATPTRLIEVSPGHLVACHLY